MLEACHPLKSVENHATKFKWDKSGKMVWEITSRVSRTIEPNHWLVRNWNKKGISFTQFRWGTMAFYLPLQPSVGGPPWGPQCRGATMVKASCCFVPLPLPVKWSAMLLLLPQEAPTPLFPTIEGVSFLTTGSRTNLSILAPFMKGLSILPIFGVEVTMMIRIVMQVSLVYSCHRWLIRVGAKKQAHDISGWHLT